jgi:putative transposase
MRQLRFTEEQIVSILRQPGEGETVESVCRKAGIARQTFYRWRLKYGSMAPTEIERFRRLEYENRRLRKLVAYLSFDEDLLELVLHRKPRRTAPVKRRPDATARHTQGSPPPA